MERVYYATTPQDKRRQGKWTNKMSENVPLWTITPSAKGFPQAKPA